MSIWDDKNGRKHVGVMVGGKRVHRILQVGATEGDAKLVEAQLRTAIDKAPAKKVNIPGDPMLVDVMALYMEHADTLRSAKTAKHHAVRFGPWAAKYRASQTRQAAAAFIKDAKGAYADATINWSLSTLKKALELAYDADMIPVNYSDQVKTLKVRNIRDIVLTLDQVNDFSAKLSDQARAAMWIALYTACRRGEVLKIQKEDIGEETMVIRMGGTKTLKTRTIPIITPLRPWLAFVPLQINYEGVKSSWRRARTELGLEHMTFHDLRRSCATMMIAAGVDLYVVSKLLGHSSVTVTQQRYGHLQVNRIADGLTKTFG
ncbi:MAG: site-specific integrase [Pseudomonadota bacterium]